MTMTKLNGSTAQVDPVKLMAEFNQRPHLWRNILQSMTEATDDELADTPPGEQANFETLLAYALGEHTGMFTDEGDETEWLDVYYDGAQGDEVPTAG